MKGYIFGASGLSYSDHIKTFRLSTHGIKDKILKLISSFLGVRTQPVVLEGESSLEVPVTTGVPQGSVLGPLLFLFYTNDLPENIQYQVRLFADDTAVINPNDSNILQSDLDKLQEWERTSDMEFNPSKCQALHISRDSQQIHSQYTLYGEILESVSCAISITKNLSWNTHTNKITSKAYRTLGLVKRNVRTTNQSVKELAYKTDR